MSFKATVPDTPVSEQLGDGGTITVPDGEVWRVTVSISGEDPDSIGRNDWAQTTLNSDAVLVACSDGSSDYYRSFEAVDTVLVGGDTLESISEEGDNHGGTTIQGFDVSDTVDNEPVSIQLGDGETTTVPSGETWKVTATISGDDLGSPGSNDYAALILNGKVLVASSDANDSYAAPWSSSQVVLTGGDTLESVSESGGNHGGATIQGFVVSD